MNWTIPKLAIVMCVLVCGATLASAQTIDPVPSAGPTTTSPTADGSGDTTRHSSHRLSGPRLGEHLFSPLAGQQLPFIRTSTTMNLGGGVSSGLSLPLFTVGGKPVYATTGDLAVIIAVVRHEQAIKDWMSFYVELRAGGRLGTNVTSLLAQGVNSALGFDIGWNVRVIENTDWSVVTGLSLREGTFTTIDLERFARGVVDSGFISPENTLLDSKPSIRGMWTSRAAHTFSPALGMFGGINLGIEEPRVRGGDYRTTFDALLALSVDWNPVIEVPLGTTIGVEYRENPDLTGADDRAYKNFYLRFGYTGTDAFGLGVQAIYQIAPIGGAVGQVSFVTGIIDMRFYF